MFTLWIFLLQCKKSIASSSWAWRRIFPFLQPPFTRPKSSSYVPLKSFLDYPAHFLKPLQTACVFHILVCFLQTVCRQLTLVPAAQRGTWSKYLRNTGISDIVTLLWVQSENIIYPAALLSPRGWGMRLYLEESCKWLPRVSSAGAAGDHCECWFPSPAEIRGGLRNKQEMD